MDKYPKPGKTSYQPLVSEAKVLSVLKKLASSNNIQSISQSLGKEACLHIVGGSIRDIYCGNEVSEIDLCTVYTPEQSQEILSDAGIKVVETGIKHGTLTIVINEEAYEITTFRKAGLKNKNQYSDSVSEDLKARDFTINAIAYSVDDEKIIDPLDGRQDLAEAKVRAVGNPEDRFLEDPLRILRMVRFGPASARTVDRATLQAAKKHGAKLQEVSPERIKDELQRILLCSHASDAVRMLSELDLLNHTIPELIPTVAFEQNEFHIHDVFEHTLAVLDRCPNDLVLRLTALFHDIGKPPSLSIDEQGRRHFYSHERLSYKMCKTAMKRLKFSNKLIKDVSTLVQYHMRPLECGPAAVRRLMRDLEDLFEAWLLFKVADAPPTMGEDEFQKRLDAFKEILSKELERQKEPVYGKLAVDGRDLIAIGFKPGKKLGQILKQLEELVIEDPDNNTQEYLIKVAKQELET